MIVGVGRGGNSSDIDLIKDLVTTYISKPSCLILLTVTCESTHIRSVFHLCADIFIADFENQGAHNIAKQHDPEGKRTIGMFAPRLLGGRRLDLYRRFDQTGQNPAWGGGKLATVHPERCGAAGKRVVHGQATGIQRAEHRNHMGGRPRPRKTFLHNQSSVVECRDVLSE